MNIFASLILSIYDKLSLVKIILKQFINKIFTKLCDCRVFIQIYEVNINLHLIE
jgi:hypothetical protein